MRGSNVRGPATARVRGVLVGTVLAMLGPALLLPNVARPLVISDPLAPAVAIVVLAGGVPAREQEAAALFQAGVAPRVVLVPERINQEPMLRSLGRRTTTDIRKDVLMAAGVPVTAIIVADGEAVSTVDELEIADRALAGTEGPVVLVTSLFHTRRVRLVWDRVGGQERPGIVRSAQDHPASPDSWWLSPSSLGAVVHEYLGLLDWAVGSPLANWMARREQSAAREP
jgi:uncharacterized SAM-binding protein YcdF (DUF218 family)